MSKSSTIEWVLIEDELPPDKEHVLATLRDGGYFTVVRRNGPRLYNNGSGMKIEKMRYWARVPYPVEGENIRVSKRKKAK